MGACTSAKRTPGGTDRLRRRLTVSHVDEGECEAEEQIIDTNEDRSLLMLLSKEQLIDMINKKGDGRKFSIGSETDKHLEHCNSFSSKTIAACGDNLDTSKDRIGFACKKGLKPESPNQDSFFICKVEGQYSIYGVFDGHGRKGHDISNFVKENLPKILVSREEILADPVASLKLAFDRTQKLIEQATNMQKINANRSGTTASVILHDIRKSVLWVAHVGDSRCVLAKMDSEAPNPQKVWQAVDLTLDHKPNLPAEKARIEKQGGQVIFDGGFNYRVYAKGKRYPGLNMSRAMGDLVGFYDAGISAMPDVVSHVLNGRKTSGFKGKALNEEPLALHPHSPDCDGNEKKGGRSDERKDSSASGNSRTSSYAHSISSHSIDPARDKFLLLCSDGVWEFVSSQEAVQAVAEFPSNRAMDAAEHLASLSWDRWIEYMQGEVVDDITAVIVHLDQPECKTNKVADSDYCLR